MFYTSGTTGLPKGVRRKPMTAGTGRGLGAGRRHRLWRQAERGSGHPDERPDVSFGAELLRHAGVPQRLHNRARTALRSRGHAATDRASSRHPHAHGADDVRAPAAAAGRGQAPLRFVVAALHRAWRGALPAAGQARHDRVVGTGHQRIFRLDRNRHSGVALGRGGAGKTRHRRPRHRRRHRQNLPPRRRAVRRQRARRNLHAADRRCRISTITARPRRAPRPAATASSASATSATSTRTAICSCATASATW